MGSSSMPVMPTHPRWDAVALWSVTFPPVLTPYRWDKHEYTRIPIMTPQSDSHNVLILTLSVPLRIQTVPGNFTPQLWPVEKIVSTISPTKAHEYFRDSSFLQEWLLLWNVSLYTLYIYFIYECQNISKISKHFYVIVCSIFCGILNIMNLKKCCFIIQEKVNIVNYRFNRTFP